MELSDTIEISVPMQTVYNALNNVDILKKCIPGCEELVKISNNQFEAKVVLKMGPVKARFSGQFTVDASAGPEKLSLLGQGNGAAGFAKGGADVKLLQNGEVTVLSYTAKAEIGGKLAQLGSRLIQSTAKKLATKFFKSFSEVVVEEAA